MLFTDKQFYVDKKLAQKLSLIADRCTGKNHFDNLILVDGDEGYGKTNFSVGGAYYLASITGRTFSDRNVFFDPDEFIKFASSTEDQIIVFDEAAMIALASEWQSKFQKKLMKFLMAARKKRHIYFFNVPKFFRLNEYLVVDRSIALIHVYARKERELGRFAYFKKENKNRLYYEIKRTKRRDYRGFYNFHGSFPEVLSKIIDEKAYDKRKDEAIDKLVNEDGPLKVKDIFFLKIKYEMSQLPAKYGMSVVDLAASMKVDPNTIYEWRKIRDKYPELWENPGFAPRT